MRKVIVAAMIMISSGFTQGYAGIYGDSTIIAANKTANFNHALTGLAHTVVDYFHSDINENSVQLKWSTINEANNDYFTVERSLDGIHYEVIGMIKGNRNSSVKRDYTFNDDAPLNGKVHYRLGTTDYDGKEIYTNTVITYTGRINKNEMRIFPVVSNGKVIIEVITGADSDEKVSINVVSIAGEIIYNEEVSGHFSTISLDKDVKPGIYMIQVSSGNLQKSKRLALCQFSNDR